MNQSVSAIDSQFQLTNANGCTAVLASLGACLRSLMVPNATGEFVDVVLGLENEGAYREDDSYLGVIVGRYSGRIARGELSLGDTHIKLGCNEWPNHIHGGAEGLSKRHWKGQQVLPGEVVFTYLSPDGDEGYPGNLELAVKYRLTDDNALRIEYEATSDKDTVINLTNHAYFNLDGHGSGNVLGHHLQISSDRIAEIDGESIPTGRFVTVAGTPFDFRQEASIGDRLGMPHPQLDLAGGFDHAWVLDGGEASLDRAAAVLFAPRSQITMRCYTDQPSVQFYSANHFPHSWVGKEGASYGWRQGLCLETQHLPNSPNEERFPSTLLRAGERFTSSTVYQFGVGQPDEWQTL